MSIAIALSITDRHVYVIGGGAVALRKCKQYLEEGAIVHVIAISFLDAFSDLMNIEIIQQSFSWDLIASDAFLLYAATDHEELNHELMLGCKNRNILCGSATQDDACDFHSMMQLQADYLQLALSTNGTCPGATKAMLLMLSKSFHELNNKSEQLARIRHLMPSIQGDVLASLVLLQVDNLRSIAEAYERKQPLLLMVYHGIANVQAMKSTMQQMKTKILNQFSNIQVLQVFASEKIAQKARAKVYDVDTYQDITKHLTALQLPYLVQPMLLQKGEWFAHLTTQDHPVGECLLENKQDVEHLYQIIKQTTKDQPILCVYHDVKQDLFSTLTPKGKDLFVSLSKFSSTTIQNHKIVPLFIFLGHHASQIIQLHSDTKIAYDNKGLLENPDIQAMFFEKISKFVSKTIV